MTRHVLRPGFHVLRREHDQVQIGLQPHHAVILDLTPDVRRTLDTLAVAGPAEGCDPEVMAALDTLGLLVQLPLARVRPPRPAIEIRAYGASPLLGLDALVEDPGEGDPQAVLLVGAGEIDRSEVDPLMQAGLPHCLVRFMEGDALIGPLVMPGVSPCVRCLDAHQRDHDPRWPLLVASHARASALPRADGLADHIDEDLARLALAWALNDLCCWLRGGAATTVGGTVTVSGQTGEVEITHWRPHPGCGCGWSVTMEA